MSVHYVSRLRQRDNHVVLFLFLTLWCCCNLRMYVHLFCPGFNNIYDHRIDVVMVGYFNICSFYIDVWWSHNFHCQMCSLTAKNGWVLVIFAILSFIPFLAVSLIIFLTSGGQSPPGLIHWGTVTGLVKTLYFILLENFFFSKLKSGLSKKTYSQ